MRKRKGGEESLGARSSDERVGQLAGASECAWSASTCVMERQSREEGGNAGREEGGFMLSEGARK